MPWVSSQGGDASCFERAGEKRQGPCMASHQLEDSSDYYSGDVTHLNDFEECMAQLIDISFERVVWHSVRKFRDILDLSISAKGKGVIASFIQT
jgi:hypothetical protein